VIGSLITLSSLQETSNDYEVIYADFFDYEGIEIRWLDIAGFQIKSEEIVVYVDPINIEEYYFSLNSSSQIETHNVDLEKADHVVITHSHSPHSSGGDIQKVSDNETEVISGNPGDVLQFDNITFEFVPAYNIDKYRPSGVLFHPPSFNWVGVIIDLGGVRIYHAGDTDRIPEMKSIETDIALLPVSGYAWMDPTEAAGAVKDIKESSDLKYAVPMHYGFSSLGSEANAVRFSELANCDVVILEPMFG
jgi:L-ascorbate metabolism protein UlaG (beta-lactamase superfamily)